MSKADFQEKAYVVNDASILHLRECAEGCQYEAFDMASKEKIGSGLIPWEEAADSAARTSIKSFREKACDALEIDAGRFSPVSIRMLEKCRGSDIRRRGIWEPDTLPKTDIRFINSRYEEQFRIPDGGCIQVEYPDRQFSVKCRHIDEYHAYIGTEVFHICQFAELMERNGGKCQPEPESEAKEMGWRLGSSRYLTVQNCEDGWKFCVYDDKFTALDGGLLPKPELSINEARNEVMEAQKLGSRSMTMLGYGFITEMAGERAAETMPERRESLIGKLESMKASRPEHPVHAPRKQHSMER